MSAPLSALAMSETRLAAFGVDLPDHREIVVGIDRAVLGRQVADVAEGGQDLVVRAEILVDRLRLGGRFDDDDVHGGSEGGDAGQRWQGGVADRQPRPSRRRFKWASGAAEVNLVAKAAMSFAGREEPPRLRLSPLAERVRPSAERAERSEAGVRGRSRKRRPSAPQPLPSMPPCLLRRLAAFASRAFPACASKNAPRVDPRSGGHHPRRGKSRVIVGRKMHRLGMAEPGRAMRRAARLARAGNSPYSGRLSMASPRPIYPHRHLLGIEGLSPCDINALLDLADEAVEVSRQIEKKKVDPARPHADQPVLRGLDPHAIVLRARRQAARRRRHEHVGRLLLGEEGRDADRHGDDAQRHAAGHPRRPPSSRRRGRIFWRRRSTARSSMPATARTSTRRRRCSTR